MSALGVIARLDCATYHLMHPPEMDPLVKPEDDANMSNALT